MVIIMHRAALGPKGGSSVGLNPSVLVIDDEPDITTYLCTLLSDHGFTALSANNSDEALQKLQEYRPDVILLDLIMPEKTGINLFNKIKKDARCRDIPIIIITGAQEKFFKDYKGFFEGLHRRKPYAFLEKPIHPDHLIQTVKGVLEANLPAGKHGD